MKKVLLIKFGEVFLRGKNRKNYLNQIIVSIKNKIAPFESCQLEKEQGRFLITSTDDDFDFAEVLNKLKNIMGINALAICAVSDDSSLEALQKLSLELMLEEYRNQNKTFKVFASRSDKNYPMTSTQIGMMIGGYILENMPNLKVDVSKPQISLKVEIRTRCYVYANEIKTLCGLPYGSSGKGILLLSGGIDSPVAGFLMARRGVALDMVYFQSPPYTSIRALEKVKDLALQLSEYMGKIKLNVVNFTEVQLYMKEKIAEEKLTIFLKRSMLRVSEMISDKESAKGLVVGDSIGQVASQTMDSIFAINSAVNIPVYRPLAGLDKEEIIKIAKDIGTFDISIRPYEDCCTIFVPKHPDLKPSKKNVEELEKKLPYLSELLEKAFNEREIIFIN